MRRSKRYQDIRKKVDVMKSYTLEEALVVLQECPKAKFDESIELSLKIGIDPKKSDQQVRGTVALPRGTGKTIRVAVIAKGDKVQEAKAAGADEVGSEELCRAATRATNPRRIIWRLQ